MGTNDSPHQLDRRPALGEALTLRASTTDDADYIYRVVEATMRAHIEATWGQWDESVTRAFASKAAGSPAFALIYLGEKRVGVLNVERHDTHIQLEQIFIEAHYQRRGIGTRLLRELMAESRRDGKPIRLRVLRVNPARAFYERLGFAVASTSTERYFMEYAPPPRAA